MTDKEPDEWQKPVILDEETQVTPVEHSDYELLVDEIVEEVSKEPAEKRSGFSWFKAFLYTCGLLIGFTALEALIEQGRAMLDSPEPLGLVSLGLAVLSLLFLVMTLLSEWFTSSRIKRRSRLKEQLLRISESESYGQLKPLLPSLAKECVSVDYKTINAELLRQDRLNLSDQEQLNLLESFCLLEQDRQAQEEIAKTSGQIGLLVGLSPVAGLDMLIVVWHSERLLRKLLRTYGVHLGFYARLKFTLKMLRNTLLVGATELLTDAGTELLGSRLLGTISARVAQGAALGLLTARLGLQIQKEVRPMPFISLKPEHGKIRTDILLSLKNGVEKALKTTKNNN